MKSVGNLDTDILGVKVVGLALVFITALAYWEQGPDTALIVAILVPAIWLPLRLYLRREKFFLLLYVGFVIISSLLGFWIVNIFAPMMIITIWLAFRFVSILR